MEDDLIKKIIKIVEKRERMEEDNVRSLMILIRKLLDKLPQKEQINYLTLRLFCNWSAHIEITHSNTGLRILATINDAVVGAMKLRRNFEIRAKISEAISFSILRKELISFLQSIDIQNIFSSHNVWGNFISILIEIIRDVPISFPELSKLKKSQQNIYNEIANNPIRPDSGVISIKIDLFKFPPPENEIMSLFIKTKDTTTLIIPLLINVTL